MRHHRDTGCICPIELLIGLALAVLMDPGHRMLHPVGTVKFLPPPTDR